MHTEYSLVEESSAAWLKAQELKNSSVLRVRGPANNIRVGDWVVDCLISSLVVTKDDVYLSLKSSSTSGYPIGYIRVKKSAVVSWERIVASDSVSDYVIRSEDSARA
jgi:hypothetical protein